MMAGGDTNEPRVPDVWMATTREQMKAVIVGGQPIAEWEVCLRLLNAVDGFLIELNRSGIRFDDDFPEARLQEVKGMVEDYLFPDDVAALRPHQRLDAVRGIEPDA